MSMDAKSQQTVPRIAPSPLKRLLNLDLRGQQDTISKFLIDLHEALICLLMHDLYITISPCLLCMYIEE